MDQIVLNFDANEYEGYEKTQDFFQYQCRTLRDETGRHVKLEVQAMQMDFSPSQWSQKLHRANNTSITLDNADAYTDVYGDIRWIKFAFYKHVLKKKRNREELLRIRDEIDRQLQEEG